MPERQYNESCTQQFISSIVESILGYSEEALHDFQYPELFDGMPELLPESDDEIFDNSVVPELEFDFNTYWYFHNIDGMPDFNFYLAFLAFRHFELTISSVWVTFTFLPNGFFGTILSLPLSTGFISIIHIHQVIGFTGQLTFIAPFYRAGSIIWHPYPILLTDADTEEIQDLQLILQSPID
jgi:hypothetical protein